MPFHNALVQQCIDKGLTVGSIADQFSLAKDPTHPSKSLFRLLKGGNRISNSQKLNDAGIEHYAFHASNLGKVATAIPNPESKIPLLFFAPRCRLDGPISQATADIVHPCFAERVMHGFISANQDETQHTVNCYDECPKEDSEANNTEESSSMLVGGAAAPLTPLFIPSSPEDNYEDVSRDDDNFLPAASSSQFFDWTSPDPAQPRHSTSSNFSGPAPIPLTPPPITPFANLTPLSTDMLPAFTIAALHGLAPFQRDLSPLETPLASAEMQSLLLESAQARLPPSQTPAPSHPSSTLFQFQSNSAAPTPPPPASASLPSTHNMHESPEAEIADEELTEVTVARWALQVYRSVNAIKRRERALDIEASTEPAAASVLFDALLAHYNNTEFSTPDGVKFGWVFSNLIAGVRVLKIDLGLWRQVGSNGAFTLEILSNRCNAEQQAIAKAFGSLCALHMVWFWTLPPCISPWLIMVAAHGVDNLPPLSQIFTRHFLESYDQSLAEDIARWPSTYSLDIDLSPGSPCGSLIATHLDVQPSIIQRNAASNWDEYTQMLYGKILFGTAHDIVECHVITAFCQGFNLPVTTNKTLSQTFQNLQEARHLIGLMSQSCLRNAQQVISKIILIASNSQDDNDETIVGMDVTNSHTFNADLRTKFHDRFARYLRGVGLPPVSSPYANLITDDMRQSSSAADPLYRVKALL
ncbi:hypothetical protein C0991_009876 [Blastosporella zonata]|nr:hypothetical protein C0991_009876 [Blastosporella zonata]